MTNPQQQHLPYFNKVRGRGGFMGPRPGGMRYPNLYHPYPPHPGNENFNPQFQSQFRPPMEHQTNLIDGSQNYHCVPPPPQILPQFRGHLPQQQQQQHNFRPPFMNDLNRPPRLGGQQQLHGVARGSRHPMHHPPLRPEFQSNTIPPPFRPFNGNPTLRPGQMPPHRFDSQHIRPQRMLSSGQPAAQPQFMPQRPSMQPYVGGRSSGSNHPGNLIIQAPHVPPHSSSATVSQIGPSTLPVIPRKVLINPNFKGGVEAATS